MIKHDQVTEITMLCINIESKSYAKWTSKIKRSLRPTRTQLSTISYVLRRLAKAQSTISDPTKFSKPIESETPGSGQVEPTAHPAKLETPNQKSITRIEGGETQTLGQISTKLNQTGGGWSIHHKNQEGKLRPSSGVLWAPHKPTNNKSILQTRKVRPSSSHWRDIKTRPRNPQRQARKSRLGGGRPNDTLPRLHPSSGMLWAPQ